MRMRVCLQSLAPQAARGGFGAGDSHDYDDIDDGGGGQRGVAIPEHIRQMQGRVVEEALRRRGQGRGGAGRQAVGQAAGVVAGANSDNPAEAAMLEERGCVTLARTRIR